MVSVFLSLGAFVVGLSQVLAQSNSTAAGWVVSNAPAANWVSVSSDASGKKIIAASKETGSIGGIYQSLDSGATWKKLTITGAGTGTNDLWTAVVSSTDGSTLYAGQSNKGVFSSTNGGSSWTHANLDGTSIVSYEISTVACAGTGCSVVTAAVTYGSLYVSDNYGKTFTKSTAFDSTPETWIFALANRYTSQLALTAGTGQGLYLSSDNGKHWSTASIAIALNFQNVAWSKTGQYIYASASGGTSKYPYGGIYISTDSGATWTVSTGADEKLNWSSVVTDVTGQYVTASVSSGVIYTSTNYGVTFTKGTVTGAWRALSADSTGKKLVAVQYTSGSAGHIYTSV